MARPTRLTISAGTLSWDAKANTNWQNLFDRPLPVTLHAGDESDLEATFPATSYDKCLIWVNHTVDGWTLYFSNGSAWAAFSAGGGGGGGGPMTIQAISTTDTVGTAENTLAVCTGTTYTVTLPAAGDVTAGHRVTVKRQSSGTITVVGDTSDTIDGAANFLLDVDDMSVMLVFDGTSDWIVT